MGRREYEQLKSIQFLGVGVKPVNVYSSAGQMQADIYALPKTVKGDMQYYALMAQPIEDGEVKIEPLKKGTKVTSSKTADGKTVQNPKPKVTYVGDVCAVADTEPVWVDAEFEPLNGVAASDTNVAVLCVEPKYGYCFDSESAGKITINGHQPTGVLNFSVFLYVVTEVKTPLTRYTALYDRPGTPVQRCAL